MKHSEANEAAQRICGPKAFVLLSATAGHLKYRVCLRTGAGMKVFSQGDSWESALKAAASMMDKVLREERAKQLAKTPPAPPEFNRERFFRRAEDLSAYGSTMDGTGETEREASPTEEGAVGAAEPGDAEAVEAGHASGRARAAGGSG